MEQPRKKALRLILVYTGSDEQPDALMRITREGVAEREEWRMFRRSLNVSVDELHASDLPPFIMRAVQSPPCILGRYANGQHALIFPGELITLCNDDLDLLIAALREYSRMYNVDLGFPPH